MSDRTAVPLDQIAAQRFREIEDRLRTLETRGVPGNVALSVATVGELAVTADATTPLRLNGAANWTQAIESFRQAGAQTYGVTGTEALVTRNANGEVVDMAPAPFVQIAAGGVQAITAGVVTTVTLTTGLQFSSPYPAAVTIPSAGVIVVPVSGIYDVLMAGSWPNVLGTDPRILIVQFSTNGGVSWSTLAQDGRTGINSASFGQGQSAVYRSALVAGWMLRTVVLHASATTPLNWTPDRFSIVFHAGYTSA